MRKIKQIFWTALLSFSLLVGCAYSSPAAPVLTGSITDAASHDFISYFGFKENKTEVVKDGFTNHYFYSPAWTCSLILSVDNRARIVHMKLGVPRPLLDDESVTTRGRDIVKSFILTADLKDDHTVLNNLAEEIYVRGLDLQPIRLDKKTQSEMGAAATRLQAFKVGRGPIESGDNAIFLSKLPHLSTHPSDLFETVMGRSPRAEKVYKNCRVAFLNEDMKFSKQPIRLLWCEIWALPPFSAASRASSSFSFDGAANLGRPKK